MSKSGSDFAPHEPDRLDELIEGEPVGENDPAIRGGRSGARAAVVQALYESDASGHSTRAAVNRLVLERELSSGDTEFALSLVEECESGRGDLDKRIAKAASQYPTDQMSLVDRSILRVALAELNMQDSAPERVIANEAVELAKLFGSDSSPKFINGVLGALLA